MGEGTVFSLSVHTQEGGGGRSQVKVRGAGRYPVSGLGGYPVSVKGKNFDTRFGLIHVQTGKNFFVKGTPPPPPVKGKIFDTRFGLIHVQTGKKLLRDPPPSKGKNF